MRIDEQIILLNIQNRMISSNTAKHVHKLIIVCPFVPFLLTIVLSGLPRFTDSNYTFAIFKLFLIQMWTEQLDNLLSVFFMRYVITLYISISGKPEKQNNSIIAIKRHLNWTYNVLIIRKNVLLVMWRIRVLITWHRAHDMISFNVFSILTLS